MTFLTVLARDWMVRGWLAVGSIALLGCASTDAGATSRGGAQWADLPGAAAKRAFEVADFYRCATVGAPSLASDGSLAVFGVRRYELASGKSWSELWAVRPDGSGLRQLTAGHNNDTDPQVAPDGRSVAFLSARSGSMQVWTMPLDGGEPRQLTRSALGIGGFLWSPDGEHMAA
ncbi:MAG: hypothetical protein FJ298_15805, partial [Planctomycetes bacterium]|nr:hypothetical protein [Planctomycetota bacterium]